MPIYEIILSIEEEILRVTELKPGKYPLDFDTLLMPIEVHEDERVSVFVNQARGDLIGLSIATYKDVLWTSQLKSIVSEIKFSPKNGQEVLGMYNNSEQDDEYYLSIMRFKEPPKEGSVIKRERG